MEKMLQGKFQVTVKRVDKMIDVRTQVGINPKNPYLFPSTRVPLLWLGHGPKNCFETRAGRAGKDNSHCNKIQEVHRL